MESTSGAGFDSYAIWNNDGNGFNEDVSLGDEIQIQRYPVDCFREGVAAALAFGNNNKTDVVYLLDSNGNRFGETWASVNSPEPFSASSSSFSYDNNVEIENTSGGTRTVGGVEVVYDANDELIIEDTSFQKTLNNGDSIIFTTLQINLSLNP